jgi:AhpD family alkylhydroperoxidase
LDNKNRDSSGFQKKQVDNKQMNKQRIALVDPTTASGTNKKNFDILKSALGFIPNIALAMAQSPAVLDGYMALSVALTKSRLGKRLEEGLALTLAGTNRCEYCASAHRVTAKLAGLDVTAVEAALQGKSEDVREGAALRFATAVVEKRGRIDEADFKMVTDAGFTPGEVTEIVAHVVGNIFTNYFNNVARTEIDSHWASQTKTA